MLCKLTKTFKCFKGQRKDVKHLRVDNAGENQAISALCKENDAKVKCVPLGAPKLNNMVEHGFSIRWETDKH